jgi:hypothetical protein
LDSLRHACIAYKQDIQDGCTVLEPFAEHIVLAAVVVAALPLVVVGAKIRGSRISFKRIRKQRMRWKS